MEWNEAIDENAISAENLATEAETIADQASSFGVDADIVSMIRFGVDVMRNRVDALFADVDSEVSVEDLRKIALATEWNNQADLDIIRRVYQKFVPNACGLLDASQGDCPYTGAPHNEMKIVTLFNCRHAICDECGRHDKTKCESEA